LNVYRYVGANPFNWNDPSGMVAATERGGIDGIGLMLIRGGQVATRAMLSTGARTARFLASHEGVASSVIAGTIACTFFTLADYFDNSGPGVEIVGVNPLTCGVVAMSVPLDPPTIDNPVPRDQCLERFNQCSMTVMGGSKKFPSKWGSSRCQICYDQCIANRGVWPHFLPDGRSCRFWKYRTIE
jgi:hypothetical protein